MKSFEGFLCVNKPMGVTSFEVIRRLKTQFLCKKAGHAGTLDPEATGVLIVALGQATRLIPYLSIEPKIYQFTVCFGKETDTLDHSGHVIFSGGRIPSPSEIEMVLTRFSGRQMQVPPVYSAVKIGGKRAYEIARNGAQPALKAREIHISSITLTDFNGNELYASFEVKCSGGTYVRALARDISHALGTYGHTVRIHRTACGDFICKNAISLDRCSIDTAIIPIPVALSRFFVLDIDQSLVRKISFGRDIALEQYDIPDSEWIVAVNGEEFVALLKRTDHELYHPKIVGKAR